MANTLTASRSIFSLEPIFDRLPVPGAGLFRYPLESLLGLGKLNKAYDRAVTLPHQFCESALEALGATVQVAQADLDRVPKTGPVVVVANHPFGGIEGLMMARVLSRVRPDVKLLANHLLSLIPEMDDVCIYVNPFESGRGSSANVKGLMTAMRYLRDGGLVGAFPSGEVSSLRLGERRVADPRWSKHIASMARRVGATVVPMYFSGRNGALFQMAGLVHPRLRTMLLPRELVKGRPTSYVVQIGNPITPEELAGLGDDDQCVHYLRLRTYALAGRAERQSKWQKITTKWKRAIPQALRTTRKLTPIAQALPEQEIAQQIASLPENACLAQSGDLCVYVVPAAMGTPLMHELGRLRETTFRLVGEGTGQPLDIDHFDAWYDQLVMWDRKSQRVVGGYRVGTTDRLDPSQGRGSLYFSTLFHAHPSFLRRVNPAVELGRSFIRPEYQRNYASLLLLWKGINAFAYHHPHYRYLFGAVSISANYSMLSRALIVEFLSRPGQCSRLSRMVQPANRFVPSKRAKSEALELAHLVRDLDELNAVICDIEPDGKGVPILLKQYLRLGCQPVAFNVDPNFSDCLDCLVVVDLPKADARQIDRYMGKQRAHWYRTQHGVRPEGVERSMTKPVPATTDA